MSNNQTLNFKKLEVTDATCLYGHVVIGDSSNKTCGNLRIETNATFNRDFKARSIQSLDTAGINLSDVVIRSDGDIDMDCKNILGVQTSNLSSISAKNGQLINIGHNLNMTDTIGGGKITWDCGVEIGNIGTTVTDCTGISIGQDSSSGNSSLSLGTNSGSSTGSQNISFGDQSGTLATGIQNINIGPGSTTLASINKAITIGCDAVAAHEGAIVFGPGLSCEPNMLSLNFPSGNSGIQLGAPPGLIPAYLRICVNGTPYHILGYVDDCYEPIILPFSQTNISIGGYQGQNKIDGNKQGYIEYFDKFTGEPAPNGGFLVQYSSPGDSIVGPTFNYVSGLRILDFTSAATEISSTMYDIKYNLYTPLNSNPSPPAECLPDGWLVRTIPVLKWVEATNVQLVNFGTTAQVSWDPLPIIEEYAISVIVVGTALNYNDVEVSVTHYYGKLIPADSTSTNIDISQTGTPESYWVTVTSITAKVVGYELCDKSPSPADHCAPQNDPPVVNAGPNTVSNPTLGITLSGSVTDDGFFYPSPLIKWRQISGPGTAIFVDDTSLTTHVTFSVVGAYVLELEADDGMYVVTDTINVNVLLTGQGSMCFTGSLGVSALMLIDSTFVMNGNFTIEWWQYSNTPLYDQTCIFDIRGPGSFDDHALMFCWRSFLNFYIFRVLVTGGSGLSTFQNGINYVNQWIHIAIVRTGIIFRMFMNGVQMWSFSDGNPVWGNPTRTSPPGTFRLGEFASYSPGGFDTPPTNYSGYLTNFRIVNGTAIYTGNFTPSTVPLTAVPGTIMLLRAENTGNPVADSSIYNKLLTNNGITWSNLTPF